MLLKHNQR